MPLAQLDGNEITSRRTAAASALAASHLARADARRLLILGTGRVAALLAEAMRCVRPIDEVVVWNHRPASAERLAGELRAAGVAADRGGRPRSRRRARGHRQLRDAVDRGRWCAARGCAPGTHLDLIGSFTPQMREADAECFAARPRLRRHRRGAGQVGRRARGDRRRRVRRRQLQGTLAELCAGTAPGRPMRELTLFKAVGTALEDLAAAELVFDAGCANRYPRGPA